MRFLNWKLDNMGKHNKNKNKHKGSNNMSTDNKSNGNGNYQGTYPYQSNYTPPADSKMNCSHTPEKGCAVGKWKLYPTAEKHIFPRVMDCFDVLCPLTESGGFNMNYNEFCGLIMWIPIKDFSAPDALRLRVSAQRIVELMQHGNNIALWCMGSHGRTGTVLATCIGLVEPDVDPIDTVRARHCSHAVETQGQIEVVFKALKRALPEKWKAKVVTAEPRKVPGCVTQGRSWRDKSTGGSLVSSNKWVSCTYCKMAGSYSDPIHWYGQTPAHTECFNQAVRAADKEKAAGAQPKALSPVAETQPNTANAETLEVTDEEYRDLVAANRPFNKRWSAEHQTKLVGIENELDCFGDVICLVCQRLVIDPTKTVTSILNQVYFLEHSDCKEWKDNPDCDVLCGYCHDAPADPDGFCSIICSMNTSLEKANNNEVLAQRKTDNTQDTTNPNRVTGK